MPRTLEEIEDLKSQWEADDIWDIEDTEGFEDHYDELYAYRKQKELEWRQKAEQEVKDKAICLGCPENLQLARYVMRLEDRLEWIESKIEKLENK